MFGKSFERTPYMNGYLGMKDYHTLYIRKPRKSEKKAPRIHLHSLFLSLVFNGGFGVLEREEGFGDFDFLMDVGVLNFEKG